MKTLGRIEELRPPLVRLLLQISSLYYRISLDNQANGERDQVRVKITYPQPRLLEFRNQRRDMPEKLPYPRLNGRQREDLDAGRRARIDNRILVCMSRRRSSFVEEVKDLRQI
jgi:hypothetical protein